MNRESNVIKEVAEDIFQIQIPLPGSPLKILNSYLIKGDGRNLLVDTGFNHDLCEETMLGALDELKVSLADTEIFLTHFHSDHVGLVDRLKDRCRCVYASEYDGHIVNINRCDYYWEEVMEMQDRMGVPEGKELHYTEHPGYVGGTLSDTDITVVEDGDIIPVGRYRLRVTDMKGHTPGMLGLYDEKHKILFSADHLLAKITPNINAWDYDNDYLKFFLDNLEKISGLDIELVLPGHRALITDHRARVEELKKHHERRLNAIKNAIANGDRTIYEIALAIPWDFAGGYFGDFPNAQKWFAANEVFAHLQYLTFKNEVKYTEENKVFYYELV